MHRLSGLRDGFCPLKFMKRFLFTTLALSGFLGSYSAAAQSMPSVPDGVPAAIQREYPNLFEIYKHLHSHPELSFQEEKTAALVAQEFKSAGYEVTIKVGRHGVVAI